MEKVGRVHVLQALEALIHDVLLVDVLEDVSSDNSMEIGIHEIEHQIDVAIVFSTDNILQSNDVLVTNQLLQEDDFTEGTLCISCILESIKVLLYGHNLLGSLVDSLPDDAVSSLSYSINKHKNHGLHLPSFCRISYFLST